jgi:hypothetical protein
MTVDISLNLDVNQASTAESIQTRDQGTTDGQFEAAGHITGK